MKASTAAIPFYQNTTKTWHVLRVLVLSLNARTLFLTLSASSLLIICGSDENFISHKFMMNATETVPAES